MKKNFNQEAAPLSNHHHLHHPHHLHHLEMHDKNKQTMNERTEISDISIRINEKKNNTRTHPKKEVMESKGSKVVESLVNNYLSLNGRRTDIRTSIPTAITTTTICKNVTKKEKTKTKTRLAANARERGLGREG